MWTADMQEPEYWFLEFVAVSIEIFIQSLLKLRVKSTANGKAEFSWHNFRSISACHIFFHMTQE
jgi:hypothetical protein